MLRAALFPVLLIALLAQGAIAAVPSRVVSMSPGITATLAALDLLDQVVGVTDWCDWPSGAGTVERIGGHIDPNYEAILSLSPDLVIVEAANQEGIAQLAKLDLIRLTIEHRHIDGILESISLIGEACGRAEAAADLLEDMRARLLRVEAISKAGRGPRVLITVGRDVATGNLRDLYAAAPSTFLGELLERSGGVNIVPDQHVGYPVISREAILRLDPEVVLELAPELEDDPGSRARLLAAWGELTSVSAVKKDRVHVICDQNLLIPGPNFLDTLEIFVAMLFPRTYAGE